MATNPPHRRASRLWATLTATYARRAGLIALAILVLVGLALIDLAGGSAASSLGAFDQCIDQTAGLSANGTPVMGGRVVQPAAEQIVARRRGVIGEVEFAATAVQASGTPLGSPLAPYGSSASGTPLDPYGLAQRGPYVLLVTRKASRSQASAELGCFGAP